MNTESLKPSSCFRSPFSKGQSLARVGLASCCCWFGNEAEDAKNKRKRRKRQMRWNRTWVRNLGGVLLVCFDMANLSAICALSLRSCRLRWHSHGSRRTWRDGRVSSTIGLYPFLFVPSNSSFFVTFKADEFCFQPWNYKQKCMEIEESTYLCLLRRF